MTHNRTVLRLESLTTRIVPSTVAIPNGVPRTVATAPRYWALAGLGSGTFHISQVPVVDSGSQFVLNGTARLAGLGQVNVAGSIRGVGMVVHGRASGMLTFSNSRGSVTVELTGLNQQPGFSAPSPFFRYRIVSSTGQFAHIREAGTLRIDLTWMNTPAPGLPIGKFRLAI